MALATPADFFRAVEKISLPDEGLCLPLSAPRDPAPPAADPAAVAFYAVVLLHVVHYGYWIERAAPALYARTFGWYLAKVGALQLWKYVCWFHGFGVFSGLLLLQLAPLGAAQYLYLAFVVHTLWDLGKVHGTDPKFLLYINMHHLGCVVGFLSQPGLPAASAWRSTAFHSWMWLIHSFGMLHDVVLPRLGVKVDGGSRSMRIARHVYSACFMYFGLYLYFHAPGQPGLGWNYTAAAWVALAGRFLCNDNYQHVDFIRRVELPAAVTIAVDLVLFKDAYLHRAAGITAAVALGVWARARWALRGKRRRLAAELAQGAKCRKCGSVNLAADGWETEYATCKDCGNLLLPTAALPERAPGFRITLRYAPTLCLQARADGGVELGEQDGSPEQQWTIIGDQLQNGNGLFLDTEVQYVYMKSRSKPWESCGTALRLRPRTGGESQRWFFDADKCLLRHVHDGRAVAVADWRLAAGQEVRVNIAHTDSRGMTLTMPEMPLQPAAEPRREERDNCYLKCAKNRGLCLEVDPETKETRLGACSDSPYQRWHWVDEKLQNVGTGTFLTTAQQYIYVPVLGRPWEGNQSPFTLAAPTGGDDQRWVFEGSHHGGQLLRQFRTGRVVDVHGWNLAPGTAVSVTNSAHGTCDGVAWVLEA